MRKIAQPAWILFGLSSSSSNIPDDFEPAAIHFNLEAQPQFAAHTSVPVPRVASDRPGQNETSD